MNKKSKKNVAVEHCWHTRGVWSDLPDKCDQLEEYIHCRNCPIFSSEGKRVLNRVAPAGYLKGWTKRLSAKKQTQKIDSVSVLVFRVNNEWFAIPAKCLHEITEKRTIHRIPRNKNKDITGVINISGEIRVCYSLESILGVKCDIDNRNKGGDEGVERFIVVILGGSYYVFYVNQIRGLSWYTGDEIAMLPATLGSDDDNMLSGVIKQNKSKIAVIDIDKLQINLEGIQL